MQISIAKGKGDNYSLLLDSKAIPFITGKVIAQQRNDCYRRIFPEKSVLFASPIIFTATLGGHAEESSSQPKLAILASQALLHENKKFSNEMLPQ